jgi:chromosome partitioning protein
MKIISILNQKGGAGKTTIAVNRSYGIAVKRYKVLLIDANYQ